MFSVGGRFLQQQGPTLYFNTSVAWSVSFEDFEGALTDDAFLY